MIETALPSLKAWTDALVNAPIPALPGSVAELEQLRLIEDASGTVDAHTLASELCNDPLMTLNVLQHVSRHCTSRGIEPPETLIGAIVMLGIGPFFKAFQPVHSITNWLKDQPEAQSGLLKVITRARRAANFATGFALRRQDEDAMVIQEAALLHDFAEMLLWCHAPKLAMAIADRQRQDHTVRSIDIQEEVLGIRLGDLGQELMQQWRLPDMLIKCTNDRETHSSQIRTVVLGVQIARHTQHGWADAHAQSALPDDVAEVGQLLTISSEAAHRLLMAMDS
jgi:HD-like signal output (HDOD) protein